MGIKYSAGTLLRLENKMKSWSRTGERYSSCFATEGTEIKSACWEWASGDVTSN